VDFLYSVGILLIRGIEKYSFWIIMSYKNLIATTRTRTTVTVMPDENGDFICEEAEIDKNRKENDFA